MTVDFTPVSSVLGTQASTAGTAVSTTRNDEIGKDAFLKLLVAQLRYQDPLNPSDSSEFVAQTAQLDTVEKLGQLVSAGEDSLALQQVWSAAALVGRTVTWEGDTGTLTGTVDAAALQGGAPVLRVDTGSGTPVEVPLSAVTEISTTA